MTSEKPSGGTRDGQFVVFRDWDMPMHDIAYYPALRGQVDNLKQIALSNIGALITAFNTDGWVKSCPSHDFSKWVRKPGINLYVRVEYPGWYFIQGMDSRGNDLDARPLDTNVAGIMVNTTVNFTEERAARVAGFNTNGWVKTKILSSLTNFSDFPLDGLYVRTEFPGYEFYQGRDSKEGDIARRADLVNDIPPLIAASRVYSNSYGFNTNAWIKHTINVPPPDSPSEYNVPTKGIYVCLEWPGFVYLPMLGSPGGDVERLTGKRVWELVNVARADDKIVAFNTNGWIKTSLTDTPVEIPEQTFPLFGLYVKLPDLSALARANQAITTEQVKSFLFVFKGTAIIWGKWFLSDSGVRAEYNKAVAYGTQDILARMGAGSISPDSAAKEAVEMRNGLLTEMRKKSSPLGRVVAQAIKPSGLPYNYLLDKYAQKRYGKAYAQLTSSEAYQVAGDTIDAAGRANKQITKIMSQVGYVSKGLMAIGFAVSAYQVVVAQDHWGEAGHQVATWSGSIAGGQLGAGVGALVGPVGAVLGGIIGGIIGGLAGEGMTQLARWFFGGSSSLSAKEVFGAELFAAAEVAVKQRMTASGQKFLVHQVIATHVSDKHAARVAVGDIAEEMVATRSVPRVDVEVIATIIWVETSDGLVPNNGANPADLIALMKWVVENLPN